MQKQLEELEIANSQVDEQVRSAASDAQKRQTEHETKLGNLKSDTDSITRTLNKELHDLKTKLQDVADKAHMDQTALEEELQRVSKQAQGDQLAKKQRLRRLEMSLIQLDLKPSTDTRS